MEEVYIFKHSSDVKENTVYKKNPSLINSYILGWDRL